MFTTKFDDSADPNSSAGQSYSGGGFGYMKPEPNNAVRFEDEEDLLYGESGSSFKMKNVDIERLIDLRISQINFQLFAVGRFSDSIEISAIGLVATSFAAEETDILALRYTKQRQYGNLFYARHEIGIHRIERGQRQQISIRFDGICAVAVEPAEHRWQS